VPINRVREMASEIESHPGTISVDLGGPLMEVRGVVRSSECIDQGPPHKMPCTAEL
jgi:hypothetical protein